MEYIISPKSELLLYIAKQGLLITNNSFKLFEDYDELIDNAINGASRMLVGQRGLGKSATIHFLFKELKQNQTLPLLITRYDDIPLNNNEPYFLYKIMQSLCNGIAHYLFVNKKE